MSDTRLLVRRVSRRLALDALLRGAVSLALAALLALTALIVLRAPLAPYAGARLAVGLGTLGGLAALAYFVILRPMRAARSERAAARRIEAARPELAGLVGGALELGRELAHGAGTRLYSAALARAAVADADRRAAALRPGEIVDLGATARRAALFLPVLIVTLGAALAGPGPVREALAGFLDLRGLSALLAKGPEGAALPLGNLTIRYRYPAYTGLGERTVPNSTGAVRALPGTEVSLSAEVQSGARSARLLFEDGRALEMRVREGRALDGAFTLAEAGSWRVAAEDARGRARESKRFPIAADADSAPKVSLLYPAAETTLRELDGLKVEASAEDDFGLGEAALVVEAPGGTVRLPLGEGAPEGRTWSLGRLFEVAAMGVRAGETATLYVAVSDNDAVSGPKWGESERRTIKAVGRDEAREGLIEMERALLDALVALLGDHLEMNLEKPPVYARTIQEYGEETLRKLEGALSNLRALLALFAEADAEGAEESPVAATLLEIQDRLEEHRDAQAELLRTGAGREAWAAHRKAAVEGRERDVLALDALLYNQNLESLVDASDDLLGREQSLRALLEKMKSSGADAETMAALEKSVAEMERELAKLGERLSKMMDGLPEEFLNSDAAEGVDMDRIWDLMKRLKEATAQGDKARAAELLEELLAAISEMNAALNEAYDMGSGGGEDVLAELDKHLGRIAELERKQRELKDATERIDAASRERASQGAAEERAELGRKLADLLARLGGEMRAVEDGFLRTPRLAEPLGRPWAEFRVAEPPLRDQIEGERYAEARDQSAVLARLGQLFARAAEAEKRPREPERSVPEDFAEAAPKPFATAEEIRRTLEKLMGQPRAAPAEGERREMARNSGEQDALSRETDRAAGEMEEQAAKAPMTMQGPREELGAASRAMGEAAGRLGEPDAEGALDRQREALYRLSQARGDLEAARKQAMQQQRPGGGRASYFPRGMGASARVLSRHERVDIPEGEGGDAARRLREDLLQAMREKPPKEYEELVRDYYKGLVK